MSEARDRAPFIEKTNTLGGRFVREAKVYISRKYCPLGPGSIGNIHNRLVKEKTNRCYFLYLINQETLRPKGQY